MKMKKRVVALLSAAALVMALFVSAFADAPSLFDLSNSVSYHQVDYCASCDAITDCVLSFYIMDDGSHRMDKECQECWQVTSEVYSTHQQGGFVQLCDGCFSLYGHEYEFYCMSCGYFTSYDVAQFGVADNNYNHSVVINCSFCDAHIVTMDKLCTSQNRCGTCDICVKLGTMAEFCLEGSTRVIGAHGNHVQVGTCMFCHAVTSEKTVTYSADCPTCNNVHTCNENRVEYGGEHGSHYIKTYCDICSKLQKTTVVASISTCDICKAEGSGLTAEQFAYQQGYEAGKKAGEEIGYQKGYAKGAADKNYIGAGIQGFWNGLSDFYVILANGVSIGGVTLGNVITSVIIIIAIVFVLVLVFKK